MFRDVPFGLPEEPLPSKEALGFRVPLYGFDQWRKLFTARQLVALGTFVKVTRTTIQTTSQSGFPEDWVNAVCAYLALVVDRCAERSSTVSHYDVSRDSIIGTFQRYALPITWDFCEALPFSETAGGYMNQLDWIARFLDHALGIPKSTSEPSVLNVSAMRVAEAADFVVTDPPYYDAIPYSDLMDFFYVWLRRTLYGLSPEFDGAFKNPLSPKWDHEKEDGELIDDASRFGGDKTASKHNYEEGMARAFKACHDALKPDGRLVIVSANKQPDAWETLVSALIRAGFVSDDGLGVPP